MNFFKKLIIFFLASAIDIEVKALELYQFPQNCLVEKNQDCLIISKKSGTQLQLSKNDTLMFGSQSLVYRQNLQEYNIIKGSIKWTTSTDVAKFKSIAGKFIIQPESEIIISQDKEKSKTSVFVLKGSITINPNKPQNGNYSLPAGTMNWFGPINSNGSNTEGIPTALTWNLLTSTIESSNLKLVQNYKQSIKSREPANIEMISNFYHNLAKKIGALHDQRIAREEKIQKENEEVRIRVKKLFRKKVDFQFPISD